jgi:hypothetical protein
MQQWGNLHNTILVIRDPDPGVLIPVLQEAMAKILRIVQHRIPKGPEIVEGMVKIIFGHLRIAKRSVIGKGPSFFQPDLFGPVEGSNDDMDLSAAFQM